MITDVLELLTVAKRVAAGTGRCRDEDLMVGAMLLLINEMRISRQIFVDYFQKNDRNNAPAMSAGNRKKEKNMAKCGSKGGSKGTGKGGCKGGCKDKGGKKK